MKQVAIILLLLPFLLCAELPPSLDEQLFGLAGGSNYVVWCKSEGYQEFSRKVFVFSGAEFSCVKSAGGKIGDKLLCRIMMRKDIPENSVSESDLRQTIEEVRSWIVSKFPNPSFPTVNQLPDGRIGFSAENVDGQGWNVECYSIRSNGSWRVVCDCVNDLHNQGKSVSCEVMQSSEDDFDPGATKDFRPYFSRLCESDSVRRDGVLRVLFEQIGDGDYEVWRKNGCKFMPGKFLDPFTNTVVTTGSSARGRSVAVTSVRLEATIEIDEFEEAICIARSLHFMLGRRIPKANFSIEEKKGCSYVVNYPCADRFGWTLRISAERVNRSNKVAFTLELDGRGTAEDIQKVADRCVELDPATKEWVPYMVKGKARSVGSEGFNADDFDDGIQSVSVDWMKIEIQCDDGSLKTNDYVVSYQAVSDEGLVVSNFNSKAESAVFELMNLAEKKFGVENSH